MVKSLSPALDKAVLDCKLVNSSFFSEHFECLVGAGLALPSFYATVRPKGQGKPSPYETRGCGSAEPRTMRPMRFELECLLLDPNTFWRFLFGWGHVHQLVFGRNGEELNGRLVEIDLRDLSSSASRCGGRYAS